MSYKTSETRTSHIEVDNDIKYGVIEINGTKRQLDADVTEFIIELIDEIDHLKEQLEYFYKESGNA